ncbi:UBN2_3 domain-containing protein [Cephalotus follicularis]|uniref:UBN2_3 domain-containing protein n=1 Tax=Cephalotus follicularis TaxID=3775 RepID=A0A1Q3B4W3_CEPFO|nr:UBN2_3 domain-containing protein [Cephalotus follicularis]
MDLTNSIGGIEKLNNMNYDYWKSCMELYLQGQDLWEVVCGTDVAPPNNTSEGQDALRKWKIKAGKAMFMLKETIQKEMLDHIRVAKMPKEAWDAFATLFAKTNVARLQMLENEIGSITQDNMTISQYFMKVKGICNDIGQLDDESKISDARK